MTITAATLAGLYKPCAAAKCGQPVHIRSKVCKLCGAPSPWLAAQAEAQPVPAASIEPTPAPAVPHKVVQLPQPAFEPHFVMKDFNYLFGDVFGTFKEGQIIRDFQTITKLKNAGQPIAPASEVDNLVCCPCGCNHMFRIPERPRGKVA